MAALSPTPEQESIIERAAHGTDSLMIEAYAGCAKSSSLVMAAPKLPMVPSLGVAFNKKIATDMEKIFPKHFLIKTLNGLGHGAWAKAIGRRPELDDRKLGKIVTQVMKESGYQGGEESWTNIRNWVTQAMQQGLVPSHMPYKGLVEDSPEEWTRIAQDSWLNPNPAELELARLTLVESIRMAYGSSSQNSIISFDDQVYLSTMLGGIFPRFPIVLVDEAQDLSPLNHLQIKKSCGNRLIVVGDQKQSIYSFRGADSDSMNKLRGLRQAWDSRPLTVTFRCPKAIVDRVQDHAPGFKAFHTNAQGIVTRLEPSPDSGADWTWGWPDIESRAVELEAELGRRPEIAFLCRNNAPLIKTAFRLLRQGIAPMMLGRDIGKGLIALSKRILPDSHSDQLVCVKLINAWIEGEVALAQANDKPESYIDGIHDRGQSLLAVLQYASVRTASGLRQALEQIFSRDTGKVTLATGHKAKGLEYDLVTHLDPWRIPSKWAIQAAQAGDSRQLEQDKNLQYVIETRTRHTLLLANSEDFA